jgi:hypothetical protein
MEGEKKNDRMAASFHEHKVEFSRAASNEFQYLVLRSGKRACQTQAGGPESVPSRPLYVNFLGRKIKG